MAGSQSKMTIGGKEALGFCKRSIFIHSFIHSLVFKGQQLANLARSAIGLNLKSDIQSMEFKSMCTYSRVPRLRNAERKKKKRENSVTAGEGTTARRLQRTENTAAEKKS